MPRRDTEFIVWNHIVRKHGDQRVLTLNDLVTSLTDEGHTFERPTLVSIFKKWGREGRGMYRVGRHRHLTRISWSPIPSQQSPFRLHADSHNEVTVVFRDYTYPLRANLEIALKLPSDFSEADAKRLCQYLNSLALPDTT
jgi:hypothetical protein